MRPGTSEPTLKIAKNLLKIAPEKDVFVHSQGLGGVQQVLNPSILILLIQLRVVGLRMLSKGLHLALLRPNLSAIRLQMAVSEELQASDR